MILGSIGTVLFLFNLFVVWRVIRCDLLELSQKYFQVILILLLPFIGGIIIIFFIRSIEEDDVTKNKEFGGGPQNSLSSIDISLGDDR